MAMYSSSTIIIYHYLLSSTTIYGYGPKILWLHSPGQPNLEQMTLTFYFADGGSRSIDLDDASVAAQRKKGEWSSQKHGDVNYLMVINGAKWW